LIFGARTGFPPEVSGFEMVESPIEDISDFDEKPVSMGNCSKSRCLCDGCGTYVKCLKDSRTDDHEDESCGTVSRTARISVLEYGADLREGVHNEGDVKNARSTDNQ
jgi:hypothetical protein